MDPKRIVADGYDQMGERFAAWVAASSPDVRRWFRGEVLARIPQGSTVVEIGCGPGTDAKELSDGRRYVGVDLSFVQLSIARRRAPEATFVIGDFTSMAFRPGSLDGVVSFYVFMHVPHDERVPTFGRIFEWLRPGGLLMMSLPTIEAEDRVEVWLDVPMFFAGITPQASERMLRKTGFEIELSEIRGEEEPEYGPTDFHWVIGSKPDSSTAG